MSRCIQIWNRTTTANVSVPKMVNERKSVHREFQESFYFLNLKRECELKFAKCFHKLFTFFLTLIRAKLHVHYIGISVAWKCQRGKLRRIFIIICCHSSSKACLCQYHTCLTEVVFNHFILMGVSSQDWIIRIMPQYQSGELVKLCLNYQQTKLSCKSVTEIERNHSF